LTAQALHDVILADLQSSTYQKPSSTIPGALMANTANKCGTALPNAGFSSALVVQPSALISHNGYMYTGPQGDGTIVQFRLGTDATGRTTYKSRAYLNGVSDATGIGVADDLQSLMVFTNPPSIGLAPGNWTKLPLCEDMN
jgi:hypothetical protein